LARDFASLTRNALVTADRQARSCALIAIALEVKTAPAATAARAKTKLSLKVCCRTRIWAICDSSLTIFKKADTSDGKPLHNPH
jgi:hypothetical protein